MKKILIFKVAQMHKWMAPLERARKTDKKNGMVRYDPIKTSPNMKEGLKIHKKSEKC